jgi:hypothetical protein
MNGWDHVANLGRVSLAASDSAARPCGGVSPEARVRPRRGSQGARKGSGGFGVTRQTQLWAQHRRRVTGARQSGPVAALAYSGERLHEQQGRKWEIRSLGR